MVYAFLTRMFWAFIWDIIPSYFTKSDYYCFALRWELRQQFTSKCETKIKKVTSCSECKTKPVHLPISQKSLSCLSLSFTNSNFRSSTAGEVMCSEEKFCSRFSSNSFLFTSLFFSEIVVLPLGVPLLSIFFVVLSTVEIGFVCLSLAMMCCTKLPKQKYIEKKIHWIPIFCKYYTCISLNSFLPACLKGQIYHLIKYYLLISDSKFDENKNYLIIFVKY